MTEEQLLASSDFIGFCGRWEEDQHCPLPFADWCLENVGELAFEACVWAHEKEERDDAWRKDLKRRVYPRRQSGEPNGNFVWWAIEASAIQQADDVPVPFDQSPNVTFHDSFPAAIAYYLTRFDRELAAKYPPKILKAV